MKSVECDLRVEMELRNMPMENFQDATFFYKKALSNELDEMSKRSYLRASCIFWYTGFCLFLDKIESMYKPTDDIKEAFYKKVCRLMSEKFTKNILEDTKKQCDEEEKRQKDEGLYKHLYKIELKKELLQQIKNKNEGSFTKEELAQLKDIIEKKLGNIKGTSEYKKYESLILLRNNFIHYKDKYDDQLYNSEKMITILKDIGNCLEKLIQYVYPDFYIPPIYKI